jgi:hypothetical protein
MDERARRVGLNEAVFREVNDQLYDLEGVFHRSGGRLDLVCECGRSRCVARLPMTHEDYVALRSESTLFAVRPGHELPDLEMVVQSNPEYRVVRKREGEPARVAEITDRAGGR